MFLAPFVTEIWSGSQNKNWELLISSDAPSGQVFICRHNTYQRTIFQLSTSISFGDMRGSQNKKVGAPDFPKRPLMDKFLYTVLVRVNSYKYAKLQLPSSISY